MWLSQDDHPWEMLTFVKERALLKSDTGLAILDMNTLELTSTWNCPDGCFRSKAELHPGLICVNVSALSNSVMPYSTAITRSVTVREQPSLQERLVIRPPMGPIPDAAAASKCPAELMCKWMQPSPDQQHTAIHWCDAVDSNDSRLCIYSLLSGLCVADFDSQAVFGSHDMDGSHPHWSPNSLHILFPEVQYCNTMPPSYPSTMVANVSGSYRMLAASAKRRKQVASWSADGSYVYINGTSQAAQLSESQSISSSVWQAKTGQEVLTWEDPGDASLAVWSPAGSSIFLPDLTLVVLPADESPAKMIRQTYHAPRCSRQSSDYRGVFKTQWVPSRNLAACLLEPGVPIPAFPPRSCLKSCGTPTALQPALLAPCRLLQLMTQAG